MKTVVITGGSSGIGRAIADQYVCVEDTKVVILDIKAPNAETSATFLECDVSDEQSIASALNGISNIDKLIIAAGVTSETNAPTAEEVQRMDAVNVEGVRNTLIDAPTRLNEHAQLVFIGTDDPPKAYYKKTKEAGRRLVAEFAQEHPDLDVRTLLVGPVNTELFAKGKPPEVMQRIAQDVGLYEPEEFAADLVAALDRKMRGYQEVRMYGKPIESQESAMQHEIARRKR